MSKVFVDLNHGTLRLRVISLFLSRQVRYMQGMTSKNFSSQIREHLTQLQGQKILIFGDVGVDEYIEGEIYRISPEAPVPVVDVTSKTEKMGLSANVAANVKSLGGYPQLISVIGEDREGEKLKSLLDAQGIETSGFIVDSTRPTTAKTRIMSGQHHIVRVDSENREKIGEATQKRLQEQVTAHIKDCDAVIVQDYAKGMVTQETSQMVIKAARAAGKTVLVDPYRSTPLEVYKGANLMTPNRDEAFELGRQIQKFEDVEALGEALMTAIALPDVTPPQMVITLGAEGMRIFNDGASTGIPTFAKKVFDVTGAGDTVISAFALGLAAGWSLEMSGYFANLAAGVVVAHVGAVACTTEALLEAIEAR